MDETPGQDTPPAAAAERPDDRATHLQHALRAVRTASRLLIRETDATTLIEQVCARLTETGAYEDVWIALLDDSGRAGRTAASPHLQPHFGPLARRLAVGDLPFCAATACTRLSPVMVDDPPSTCGDCPLQALYPDRVRLAQALAFGPRVHGVMAASLPAGHGKDAEEQALFADLAGDIAFVLDKIEHMEKVAEVNTQYRHIFEHSHIPMFLIDPGTMAVHQANEAACRFYGWSKEAFVGQPIAAFNLSGSDRIQSDIETARSGHGDAFHFRHRRADGAVRDVEVHSGPITVQGRDLLFSIVHDVTERVQGERELADTKYVLEQAQTVGQIGHYNYEIPTDRWTSSPVLEAIFGIDATYPRTFESWLALVHEDDRTMARNHLEQAVLHQHRPFDQTYRLRRHSDGQVRWIHGRGRLFLDPDGRPRRLLGTIEDVTDRERTFQRLNNTIRDLELAQRIAGMGTWSFDPRTRRVAVSDQICRLYGMPIGSGTLCLDRFVAAHAEPDRPALAKAIEAAVRRRVPFDLTVRRDGDDGDPTWISVIGQPDPERGPLGALVRGIAQDITQREQAREDLRRAKEAADLANRTKSEFLANVSHEIRTPLNAVLGFAEVLSSELYGPLPHPKYREYCADIVRSGSELLDLVNDVIDLSRIEVGALEIEETWLDVAEAIQSCLRLFEIRARNRSLTLTVDCEAPPPRLYGDARRIRQILANLISNAVKFTPTGGRIVIAARRSGNSDGGVTLSVADTGVGIAPDQIDRALSVFGRTADAYVRSQDGAGLGLPLCRRLAERHQATLTIDSTPGQGTCVSVAFPATRAAA